MRIEASLTIRQAQKGDGSGIESVCAHAFESEEQQSILELVQALLSEEATPPVLSLVAEVGGHIVGFVSCSPFFTPDGSAGGYILAPLAVDPSHQKAGIGSRLVAEAIELLTVHNVSVLLVYGDPAYYGRFGFTEDIGGFFHTPFSRSYENGWQGLMLNDQHLHEEVISITCVEPLMKESLW